MFFYNFFYKIIDKNYKDTANSIPKRMYLYLLCHIFSYFAIADKSNLVIHTLICDV